ncbi:hypothetical protein D3C79_739550 [compost metagenome]
MVKKKSKHLSADKISAIVESAIDVTDRFNYEGLNWNGGDTAWVLQHALMTGSVVLDKCAPFDQLVSQGGDLEQVMRDDIKFWKYISSLYQKVNTGKKKASDAVQELMASKRFITPQGDMEYAFEDKSYSGFLDKLLVPDKCWDGRYQAKLKGDWALDTWPKKGQLKGVPIPKRYTLGVAVIKELLAKKVPVALQFCAQPSLTAKNIKTCNKAGHSVVLTGFRQICDSRQVCRDSFKVHNSWGETWQKLNDDGWIDARKLLDRTFYEAQTLTWMYRVD